MPEQKLVASNEDYDAAFEAFRNLMNIEAELAGLNAAFDYRTDILNFEAWAQQGFIEHGDYNEFRGMRSVFINQDPNAPRTLSSADCQGIIQNAKQISRVLRAFIAGWRAHEQQQL
jgi:hypothetical protein